MLDIHPVVERYKITPTPTNILWGWAGVAMETLERHFPGKLTDVRTQEILPWSDLCIQTVDASILFFIASPSDVTLEFNNLNDLYYVKYRALARGAPVLETSVTMGNGFVGIDWKGWVAEGFTFQVEDSNSNMKLERPGVLAFSQRDGQRIDEQNCPVNPFVEYAVVLSGVEVRGYGSGMDAFAFVQ